ncbi:MAG: superoxide reductase, partial [Thermovirga sp.]|nr:superoxide reductase [Thermovirga sp.]
MAEVREIYKCEICGNIVEVLHGGAGQLVCCGQPMKAQTPQTADTSQEKHVPYVERQGNAYVVRVGENALHPMEDKHYIEWIELEVDGASCKKFLKPGDEPKAVFEVPEG